MPWGTWVAWTTNPPRIFAEGGGNTSQFRAHVKKRFGIRDFEICARVTAVKEMPDVLAAWDEKRGKPHGD